MPALPELGYVLAQIRVVEVFVEMKSEYPAQAYSDVGISRKVEINVKRIENNAVPRARDSKRIHASAEKVLNYPVKLVGKYDLFRKTDNKSCKALAEIVKSCFSVVYFSGNCFITDDRSCDKLREQADIQKQFEEVLLRLYLSPIAIDNIRNDLECIEANSCHYDDIGYGKICGENCVYISHYKAAILENADHSDIENQTAYKAQLLIFFFLKKAYSDADKIIYNSRKQQENYTRRLSPCIERK